MIERANGALAVRTVQQEINVIVRPARETTALCARIGCTFVAYGALLGGLVSDMYLGRASPPEPAPEHSKQWDYLASIEQWGGWALFQQLLAALRRIGAELGATISEVALAYVLQLPGVSGVIVGIRLGASQHREGSLRALHLKLSSAHVRAVEAVVSRGTVRDGLART
jgi:aryl-alcohol dehydrogenase-like predicted oxidoreductase